MRETLYNKISIINFIIHCFWVILIFASTFFKFRENDNFYTVFTNFFGSAFVPYILLVCLLGVAVLCFFIIKKPILSILLPIISYLLLNFLCFPYVFEVGFVNLGQPSISGGQIANYGLGFEIIKNTNYILYFDIIYTVYSLIYIVKKRVIRSNK